ncbi:hypothetical protein DAI22_03g022200 [Oryza sativa Japonica Group]|nr:hypothetical protein DAI22_03g022200 [Oryza sativa Japonica Group]
MSPSQATTLRTHSKQPILPGTGAERKRGRSTPSSQVPFIYIQARCRAAVLLVLPGSPRLSPREKRNVVLSAEVVAYF